MFESHLSTPNPTWLSLKPASLSPSTFRAIACVHVYLIINHSHDKMLDSNHNTSNPEWKTCVTKFWSGWNFDDHRLVPTTFKHSNIPPNESHIWTECKINQFDHQCQSWCSSKKGSASFQSWFQIQMFHIHNYNYYKIQVQNAATHYRHQQ